MSQPRKAAILSGSAPMDYEQSCCSNRNCPSHWHRRLTEKWKMNQESKAKSSPPPPPLCQAKHRPQLVHSDILSHLFPSNAEKEKREHSNERTLPVPLDKSILLKKHRLFAQHASANLRTSTYTFRRNSLDPQMKHRMVSLETDQVELLFVSVSNDSSLFFSLDNSTTTIDPINHFSTST